MEIREGPQGLEESCINPIFKVGQEEGSGELQTGHPTPPFLGKVVEQIILQAISKCVRDKQMIKNGQCGFKMMKSWLMKFTSWLKSSLAEKGVAFWWSP